MGFLEGRAALVTGAGLGIGNGIARELAKEGARVAIHYGGSATGAQDAVDDIIAAGGDAFAVQADLREVSACERIVDAALERFSGLDILVNNAGVTRAQSIDDTTETLYDEMFDLNMKAYFFCARRAMPALRASSHGSIINISSVHGGGGFPDHVAYAATKGAIVAFTRTLAVEVAPQGVRVNGIAPGLIEVPRYFDNPTYTTEFGGTKVPIGRVGFPNDIGPVAAFLAGDGARFVTGQMLYVDGGTNAKMGLDFASEAR